MSLASGREELISVAKPIYIILSRFHRSLKGNMCLLDYSTDVACASVYFSRARTLSKEQGSGTLLTVIGLVYVEIMGQFKIIECFALKPVSHLTVPSIYIG